jgi:CDP-2,3-bis-(O-geranylgeranyl)-sn-glycerol synthase
MIDPWQITRVLLLLGVANGTPVFATKLLKHRFATPLDGGLRFFDGRPLFGESKTVRGVVLSLACTGLVAPLLGLPWQLGVELAALSLLGDLVSSFVKRRLDRPVHSPAFGLDQIPESLLPPLVLRDALGLTAADIVLVVVFFFVFELVLSRLLYTVHIRDRPS